MAECGTHRAYCDGCRCVECKAATAAYQRERRQIRKASITGGEAWHGTLSGYTNYSCRCAGCSEAFSLYGQTWWKSNPDKASEYGARWRELNREKSRESVRKWSKANRDSCRVHESLRRARKRGADHIPFTKTQLAQKWAYHAGRCYLCGDVAVATDHVKPLAKGGPHILANLKPICTPCNSRKRDKWPLMADGAV